jgi:hypothetical protein
MLAYHFDMVHAGHGDRHSVVKRVDELLAPEVPEGELHLIDGGSEQFHQNHERDRRVAGTVTTGRVQRVKDELAELLLVSIQDVVLPSVARYIAVSRRDCRDAKAFPVVRGPADGISEDCVRFYDPSEGVLVASVLVVRVVERSQETIGLRDDERTGITTDLKQFVVVGRLAGHA